MKGLEEGGKYPFPNNGKLLFSKISTSFEIESSVKFEIITGYLDLFKDSG
jgi:hypothetical protein